MVIVKPIEIASKIMCLIEEAEKFVVVVSPYYNFSNWRKLNRVMEDARKRGIRFDFFVRKGERISIQEVKGIGFIPVEITRLHAKIYFNEKEAIVSSMNLNESSDNDSLDIALQTENESEYQKIVEFYEKFIKPKGSQPIGPVDPKAWLNELGELLGDIFPEVPYLKMEEGTLTIHGSNKYEVFIANEKINFLRLNCILSEKEFAYASNRKNIFPQSKMKIELQKGTGQYYNLIWGIVPDIKSETLNKIEGAESELVFNIIAAFVASVEKMKREAKNYVPF